MHPPVESDLPLADAASPGLQLQVLAGPQRGACAPVPPGLPFTLGGSADCDIVLRGLAGLPLALRLCLQPQALSVQVLQGQAQVAGQSLSAGQSTHCAPDAELVLGTVRVGLVRAMDAAAPPQPEARQAAAQTPDGALPPLATATDEVLAPSATARRTPWWAGRRGWQALVAGGGALAAVSVGMLASAYTQPAAAPAREPLARQAQATLQAAGLGQLRVRPDAEGHGLLVTGYLDTGAQRAQAEQLLAEQPLPARWQVHVNQQVADAVADVYRINGVPAQASAVGEGAVAVTTREADASRLERVRDAARRDVPGLAAIDARNLPPPAPPGPVPVVDDPGKRLASIVPGEPPYVVTADGTRYFEGALLPTGHRIAGIERHRVLLDRDGAVTPLVF